MTPHRRTHQDSHIDDCSKANGEGGYEQALMRMAEHRRKDLGMKNITQARYESKKNKNNKIENKENERDDLKPLSIEGQLMKQDRYDAGAHCDDEPSC